MTAKPVVPRALADQDLREALAFYLAEGADQAALGFVNAVERAFRQIGRQLGCGSFRYAHALDLPGLRTWPVTRYPYLVFYLEAADHMDVWRILHDRRDLPAWLTTPAP